MYLQSILKATKISHSTMSIFIYSFHNLNGINDDKQLQYTVQTSV